MKFHVIADAKAGKVVFRERGETVEYEIWTEPLHRDPRTECFEGCDDRCEKGEPIGEADLLTRGRIARVDRAVFVVGQIGEMHRKSQIFREHGICFPREPCACRDPVVPNGDRARGAVGRGKRKTERTQLLVRPEPP